MDIAGFRRQYEVAGVECPDIALLGIRGNGATNEMGVYDDTIYRRLGDVVTSWRASTDPGRYWIQHPVNPSGCARLRCGVWRYTVGLHLGKHLALCQAMAVTVDRIDAKGRVTAQQTGFFGINIHSGGTEPEVGKWSAGCQVIHCPEGAWGTTWLAFFEPIRVALSGKSVPYVLADRVHAVPVDRRT